MISQSHRIAGPGSDHGLGNTCCSRIGSHRRWLAIKSEQGSHEGWRGRRKRRLILVYSHQPSPNWRLGGIAGTRLAILVATAWPAGSTASLTRRLLPWPISDLPPADVRRCFADLRHRQQEVAGGLAGRSTEARRLAPRRLQRLGGSQAAPRRLPTTPRTPGPAKATALWYGVAVTPRRIRTGDWRCARSTRNPLLARREKNDTALARASATAATIV